MIKNRVLTLLFLFSTFSVWSQVFDHLSPTIYNGQTIYVNVNFAAEPGDLYRASVSIAGNPHGITVQNRDEWFSRFYTGIYYIGSITCSALEIGSQITVTATITSITSGEVFTTATAGNITVIPAPNGALQVLLSPPEAINAGARWNVDGGAWLQSGSIVSLSPITHRIHFSHPPGWSTIPYSDWQDVEIHPESTNVTSRSYTWVGFGSLQVTLGPPAAVSDGAQWQVDGGPWQNTDATVSNLTADGFHTIAFKPLSGWTTPTPQTAYIYSNQTTTAFGNYAGAHLQVTLSPAKAVDAGAQWQVDGGPWEGSDTSVTLAEGNHTVSFSYVPGWGTPTNQTIFISGYSVTNASYLAPSAATANLLTTNGFVIAASISDPGCGYTNVPAVYILGGGGSGAKATATLSNGMVTGINIIRPGSGYTSTPMVAINSPFPLRVGMTPANHLTFSNLTIGSSYQLQTLDSGTWTNIDASFVASRTVSSHFVDGAGKGGSFRLAVMPIPYGATATAQLAYGFVIGATVTSAGYGYVSAPAIRVVGGGGTGALATAIISNGVVTDIHIEDAGWGYTSEPEIQIDLPPVPALTPTITPAYRLDYTGLTPNLNYQLQETWDPTQEWWNYGFPFQATAGTNSQYLDFESDNKFFRLLQQ